MNWYRWSLGRRYGSWHLASTDRTLCGRAIPDAGPTTIVLVLTTGDPPENEKSCETCLRVSHREDGL